MLSILSIYLAFASLVLGSPTKSAKICHHYTLPITITTTNLVWGLPEFQNNYDITSFTTNLSTWDSNITFNPIAGTAEVTASYKISGTFCSPTKGGSGTVLLATHGLGFDQR
jgi:hypothetical protein